MKYMNRKSYFMRRNVLGPIEETVEETFEKAIASVDDIDSNSCS